LTLHVDRKHDILYLRLEVSWHDKKELSHWVIFTAGVSVMSSNQCRDAVGLDKKGIWPEKAKYYLGKGNRIESRVHLVKQGSHGKCRVKMAFRSTIYHITIASAILIANGDVTIWT